MHDGFFTLQDFYQYAKGITYGVAVLSIIGIGLFFKFVSAGEDRE